MIFCNDTPLPWWDKEECYYAKVIPQGSGAIARLPKDTGDENVRIVVKDGTKTLKKRKSKDIPIAS